MAEGTFEDVLTSKVYFEFGLPADGPMIVRRVELADVEYVVEGETIKCTCTAILIREKLDSAAGLAGNTPRKRRREPKG
jgi:hypothetical protein